MSKKIIYINVGDISMKSADRIIRAISEPGGLLIAPLCLSLSPRELEIFSLELSHRMKL